MKKIIPLIVFLFTGIIIHAQIPLPPDSAYVRAHPELGRVDDTSAVFTFAEEMPVFPGGQDAFNKYLTTNIKYPALEKEAGKQGTVYIQFIVERNGAITNVKAVKEVKDAPGLTKESIRVFSQMPNWTPGKMSGRPVRVSCIQPVRFRLDNATPNPVTVLPTFVGGDSALQVYLSKNLVYPKTEKKAKKEGSVVVFLTIDENGVIQESVVISEVPDAPGFSKEALRLVKQMPKWNPGTVNGKATSMSVKVTVVFKMKS